MEARVAAYEWVLKDTPCSICSSIYEVLLEKTGDPLSILNMIYSRKAKFSRQFGEGISVFNPGDPIITESIKNSTSFFLLHYKIQVGPGYHRSISRLG